MTTVTPGTFALAILLAGVSIGDDQPEAPFWTVDSSEYGIEVRVPRAWTSLELSEGGFLFGALVPQPGGRPDGVLTCRVSPAFQPLARLREGEEANFRRLTEGGLLCAVESLRAEIVPGPRRDRLEVWRRYKPDPETGDRSVMRDVTILANHHIYEFSISVGESAWPEVAAAFETLIDSAEFTPPALKCDLVDLRRNRWVHQADGLIIDLPPGWSPVRDGPFFAAVGPAGDEPMVPRLFVGREEHRFELEEAVSWPERWLVRTSPPSEIRTCVMVDQGDGRVLETIIDRPFGKTEFERRVCGDEFDYLLTFACATEDFDAWEPILRASLDSFRPGTRPRGPAPNAGAAPKPPTVSPAQGAAEVARAWLHNLERGLRRDSPLYRVLTPSTALAGWFGLRVAQAHHQRRAVAAIESCHGAAWYDYQYDPDRWGFDPSRKSPVSPRLLQLAGVDFFHDVTSVFIPDRAFGDAMMAYLGDLPELQNLNLMGAGLTDRGLVYLRGLGRLRQLTLRGSQVGDAGLAHLSGLERLEDLDLGATRVGDAGLEHLQGLRRLRRLDLVQTYVTDEGMWALASLGRLKFLDLEFTRVGDRGLKPLEALTGLEFLNLSRTRVTDGGVPALKKLEGLKYLNLYDTPVTEQGKQVLRESLPRVEPID